MKINQIDDLVAHLKSSEPYDAIGTFKLWEALTSLSNQLSELNKTFEKYLVRNVVETPDGVIDGVNQVFILKNKPFDDFVLGYKNGLLLASTDWSINDNRINFTAAPVALSVLQFIYNVRREI